MNKVATRKIDDAAMKTIVTASFEATYSTIRAMCIAPNPMQPS